jgi:predicted MFS family arabinose efflux permease
MPWSSGVVSIIRTLGYRNYGIYMAGHSISMVGMWMQRVGVGWLTWELTQSATWLGAVAFADLFPAVLIGPIGGAAADRWNRLALTKITQLLSMVQACALFALTIAGLMTAEVLLALTVCLGVIGAFQQPVRLALVPSLVPREALPTAVAINSITFNLARFIGPAIAGVAIVSAGTAWAFGINAVSFAVFLVALHHVRMEETPPSRRRDDRGLIGSFGEGLRYAATHAGIGPLLLLLIVVCLCVRPFQELLPGFAASVFHGGADVLAMLTASVGIGAIVGGLWLASRNRTDGLTVLVLATTVLQAIAILALVATESLWVAIPALAVAGGCMVVYGIGTQTLLQLAIDASMRGRVLSLFGIIFRGMPAVGALSMGTVSDVTGLRSPVAVGALVVAVAGTIAWRRRMRLAVALERGPEPPDRAGAGP